MVLLIISLYSAIELAFGSSTFAIKFTWLIAEILIAIYLYKLGSLWMSPQKAFWMSVFYSLFMPSYYLSILLGCDEIIAGAFSIMSVYYFLTHRSAVAGLFLALGITYKLYPVFFFLPMWVYAYRNKKFREFVISFAICILGCLIVSLPYLILCPQAFWIDTIGQTNRLISISFGSFFQNSWFYQSFFALNQIGFELTPHLLFAVGLVAIIFFWDWSPGIIKKNPGNYDIQDFIKACIFYLAILPIISLSNNY